mmetsp:Transcript_6516/g.16455  ORF Transcript_6516/g.16455 Transcript_6516/m.16455 type:complete len:235 (-) Transcript_6516:780-1484(-)
MHPTASVVVRSLREIVLGHAFRPSVGDTVAKQMCVPAPATVAIPPRARGLPVPSIRWTTLLMLKECMPSLSTSMSSYCLEHLVQDADRQHAWTSLSWRRAPNHLSVSTCPTVRRHRPPRKRGLMTECCGSERVQTIGWREDLTLVNFEHRQLQSQPRRLLWSWEGLAAECYPRHRSLELIQPMAVRREDPRASHLQVAEDWWLEWQQRQLRCRQPVAAVRGGLSAVRTTAQQEV